MIWYKPPGLYPPSIVLGGERYFFTEPEAIRVPDGPNFADIRRNANTEGDIMIGVSPQSEYYPKVYESVWPRVRVGAVRGGVKQRQFRRLLEDYGYNFTNMNMEADHIRDMQWTGPDEYDNLWPLARNYNQAANDILRQLVTYRNAANQVVRDVPLSQTDLNLYFRIVGFGP